MKRTKGFSSSSDLQTDISSSNKLVEDRESTLRQGAEETIREDEQPHPLIEENCQDLNLLMDLEGNIISASPSDLRVLGYSSQELVGKNVFLIVHSDYVPRARAAVREILTTGTHERMAIGLQNKTGECIRALATLTPFIDTANVVNHILFNAQSINEQKHSGQITNRAERTLWESKDGFWSVLKHSPFAVFNQDRNLRYIWAYSPHPQFSVDAILGKTDDQLIPSEDAYQLTEMKRRVLDTGVGLRKEIRTMLNGEPCFYGLSVEPLRDPAGPIAGITCALMDITERKRAEEALRRSERNYRLLVERNLAGVYRTMLDGRLLDCNESFARILGYESRSDALRHGARELYFSDAGRTTFIEKLLQKGMISNEEFCLRRKDGSPVWVMEIASLLEDEEGSPTIIEGTIVDITDRKRADEALRVAELHFRQLVQSVQAIVWQGDAETMEYSFVSKEAETLLGYPAERWIGEPEFWKSHIHPDDRDSTIAGIAAAIQEKRGLELEYRMIAADGRTVWLRDMVRLVSEPGKQDELIGVMVDITQHKHVEEQLRNSREQLRALSARLETVREEERTYLAREIHDELGQVLTALKMDLSLLGRKVFDAGEMVPLELLMDDLRSMSNLLDNTIQSVKKIVTELRPEVLDELGLRAAVEWQAHEFQSRTHIQCSVSSNLEDSHSEKHRATALFRIFQETLTNIARHAHASQVWVKLHEENGTILLEVRDNGKGITQKEALRSGSLGLVGMRERALLLGGKVNIHGRRAQGTTVTVRIPLRPAGPT